MAGSFGRLQKWAWIIVGALLSAGCSGVTAYQPPNPCAPRAAQESPGGGWEGFPTPKLMALGEGYRVVCE
jgi:hypothetical protein